MIIALDWDNTFTRDQDGWQDFILGMKARGHKIWIVTARGEDTPIEMTPEGLSGIVYCNYRAKMRVTELMGLKIDVWIDDDPEMIIDGFVV
jgi:hypothetical protein